MDVRSILKLSIRATLFAASVLPSTVFLFLAFAYVRARLLGQATGDFYDYTSAVARASRHLVSHSVLPFLFIGLTYGIAAPKDSWIGIVGGGVLGAFAGGWVGIESQGGFEKLSQMPSDVATYALTLWTICGFIGGVASGAWIPKFTRRFGT